MEEEEGGLALAEEAEEPRGAAEGRLEGWWWREPEEPGQTTWGCLATPARASCVTYCSLPPWKRDANGESEIRVSTDPSWGLEIIEVLPSVFSFLEDRDSFTIYLMTTPISDVRGCLASEIHTGITEQLLYQLKFRAG